MITAICNFWQSSLLPLSREAWASVDCSEAIPSGPNRSTSVKQLLLTGLARLLRCLLRLAARALIAKIPSAEVKSLADQVTQLAIDEGVPLAVQAAENYMDANWA